MDYDSWQFIVCQLCLQIVFCCITIRTTMKVSTTTPSTTKLTFYLHCFQKINELEIYLNDSFLAELQIITDLSVIYLSLQGKIRPSYIRENQCLYMCVLWLCYHLKRNFFQQQTIKIRHIWRQLTNNKHYSTAYLFLSFSK